jgi:hypothetical protein
MGELIAVVQNVSDIASPVGFKQTGLLGIGEAKAARLADRTAEGDDG